MMNKDIWREQEAKEKVIYEKVLSFIRTKLEPFLVPDINEQEYKQTIEEIVQRVLGGLT